MTDKPPIIRVFDFESTGDTPEGDAHGLCEIAFTDVVATAIDFTGAPALWEVVEGRAVLCHPGVNIPPETAAVHNIIDEDVAGLANWKLRLRPAIRQLRDDGVIAVAGHSVDFEALWIHPEWWGDDGPLPLLCTYKTALRVWPDSPTHSNAGLMHWRRPIRALERSKTLPQHRAGPDSYVTAFHLRDFLNQGVPFDQMVEWTKLPALLVRCYIGDQHRNGGKGTPWTEVETSYLEWIINKGFEDRPDVRYTAEYHLTARRAQAAEAREREDLNRQLAANGLPTEPALHNPLTPPPPAADSRQGSLL